MPDRIYVTYTPTSVPGAFHTAIHYERKDANGKLIGHSVIEVQPEAEGMSDKAIGVMEEASRMHRGLTRLGRMDAQVTDVMADKPKKKFDSNSPYEDIAGGDDLSSHFARMQLYAHGVNRAGVAYRGSHQNSNSFASGALSAGGLRPATGIGRDPLGPAGELLEFFTPGLNDPLKAPVGEISSSVGSQEPDETAAGLVDNRRYLSRRIAGLPQVTASGTNFPSVPFVPPNDVLSSGGGGPLGDRFSSWTSSPAGITPHNPNQPVPSPESGRPLGIVTGKPMPLWITPPPIFDFSDRSAASRSNTDWFPLLATGFQGGNRPQGSVFATGAPSVPFVPSNQRRSSGPLNSAGNGGGAPFPAGDPGNTPNAPISLANWIAVLAGMDPRNPSQPAPLPQEDGARDDPSQSWFTRILSGSP